MESCIIYLSYILKIILNVDFKHKNISSVPKVCEDKKLGGNPV